MRGNTGGLDDRGVSEIYGTLLIISLAFVLAILLVAVGTFVVNEMQSESEDSLTQDSIAVMNERIADVTAGDVNATSQFLIPDAQGEIETSPGDTRVTVTVSSRLGSGYLEAEESVKSSELAIGTIAYEGSTGVRTAWQGGGLWERQQGVTSVREPPRLDYNGNTLNLGFTNLTATDQIRAGQEYTVRGDAQSGAAKSEEIRELFEDLWTIAPDGDVLGTHTVDVAIEIESEFADGWATWAEEGMQEPPEGGVTVGDDVVTMVFETVGSPFNEEFFSNHESWPDNVLYAGNSTYAVFNDAMEPVVDGGFVINETDTRSQGVIDTPASEDWYVAIYDKYEREFVITENGEDWWTRDGIGDNFRPHSMTDEDRIDRLTEQIGEDAITRSSGELDGDEGEYIYDFRGHQAVCLFSTQDPPNSGQYGYSDLTDTMCDSLVGMSDDPRTIVGGHEFVVETIEPADGSDWTDVELDDGEPLRVDATINNTGDVPGSGSAFLKVEDGLTTGITVDGITVTGMVVDEAKVTELGLTEERVLTFEWEPSDSDIREVYRGLGGANTTVKVVTGNDYETSGNVIEYEYDLPESTAFVMHEEQSPHDYFVEVWDPQNGEWDDYEGGAVDPDQNELRATATIWNEGAEGAETITLWYEDGDGDWTPVSSTEESLAAHGESGQSTDVTLEWSMDSLSDEHEEITLYVITNTDELQMATVDIE